MPVIAAVELSGAADRERQRTSEREDGGENRPMK